MSKPFVEDYEKGLLCNLFNSDAKTQNYIFEKTEKSFFINPINRTIYEEAKKLFDKYKEIVALDVVDANPGLLQNILDIHLGEPYIPSKTKTYCKRLFERKLNSMIEQAKTIEEHEQIEMFKRMFIGNFDSEKIRHISEGLETFRSNYIKNKEYKLCTSYEELDKVIGSFKGGDYIALGGSTGSGKTSFALNLAYNISKKGKKVLYFSLEMPLMQLQNRLVCMYSGLPCNKIRNYSLTDEDISIYEKSLKKLSELNINVVSEYNLTIDNLRANISVQKKKGLDFVILDYLGLMSGMNSKSLYEKSTYLSRQLKLIASEFNIPILVLVQLNRSFAEREDKRPVLSDIRESGAIEQDADFVMFTYRDCVYNSNSDENKLEILVKKNRHGSIKDVMLHFNTSTQLITDWH